MWRAMCRACPGLQYVPLVGLLVLGMLFVIIIPRGELMAQPQAAVRAPEFPDGMQWLNTDKAWRRNNIPIHFGLHYCVGS